MQEKYKSIKAYDFYGTSRLNLILATVTEKEALKIKARAPFQIYMETKSEAEQEKQNMYSWIRNSYY